MSSLKRKIQLKRSLKTKSEEEIGDKTHPCSNSEVTTHSSPNEIPSFDSASQCPAVKEYPLPMRKPRQKPTCPKGHSKNIVKNYGKALCTFASSTLGDTIY